MEMDWKNPMAMFSLAADPQQQQQSHDDVVDDDNDDDFYGEQHQQQHIRQPEAHADAQPGAAATEQSAPAAPTPAQHVPVPVPIPAAPPAAAGTLSPQQKADNEKQLQLLKAKLLAKRQNTPSRPASTVAHVGTPTPAPAPPQLQTAHAPVASISDPKKEEEGEIVDGVDSIDALLDQGKAIAEARSAVELSNAAARPTPNGVSNQQYQQKSTVQQEKAAVPTHPAAQVAHTPQRPTDTSDAYYADLSAWLELTGYHNVEFRNSKLANTKRRLELERQAAALSEEIELIKQKEQEVAIELRTSNTPITTSNMAAPPLSKTMPASQSNGLKRGRSPDLFGSEKARRQENGGFRIRGANESPTDARSSERRFSRSPPGLDRRIIYPDARRRSVEDRSRDPSLERRQSFYRRDGEPGPAPPPRFNDHYAPQSPRDGTRPKYAGGPGRNNSYTRPPQYTGNASLNLRNGGQPNGRKPK